MISSNPGRTSLPDQVNTEPCSGNKACGRLSAEGPRPANIEGNEALARRPMRDVRLRLTALSLCALTVILAACTAAPPGPPPAPGLPTEPADTNNRPTLWVSADG